MEQSQSQSQSNTLNLSLSINSSGNPALEQHVFHDLHSPGRQLSRISAVMEVLVKALESDPALQQPDAIGAIQAFRALQQDIARAKEELSPERHLVAELRELAIQDPAAHARALASLSSYLQESRTGSG